MAALKLAKESGARVTKTSIMLGCGEQPHEVLHAFRTLRENGKCLYSSGSASPCERVALLARLLMLQACCTIRSLDSPTMPKVWAGFRGPG